MILIGSGGGGRRGGGRGSRWGGGWGGGGWRGRKFNVGEESLDGTHARGCLGKACGISDKTKRKERCGDVMYRQYSSDPRQTPLYKCRSSSFKSGCQAHVSRKSCVTRFPCYILYVSLAPSRLNRRKHARVYSVKQRSRLSDALSAAVQRPEHTYQPLRKPSRTDIGVGMPPRPVCLLPHSHPPEKLMPRRALVLSATHTAIVAKYACSHRTPSIRFYLMA